MGEGRHRPQHGRIRPERGQDGYWGTAYDNAAGTETKASASATPKTGDLSPLAVAGIALVGLLAAGGVALSLARRRR